MIRLVRFAVRQAPESDLDARRAALVVESNDLRPQIDELERRFRRVKDHGERVLLQMRKQQEDDHARNEQLLLKARDGDEESKSLLDTWIQTADERQRDLDVQFSAVTTEAEALDAEAKVVAADQARINKDFDTVAATETRRIARVAKVLLMLQFVTAALGLIPRGHASARSARAIHLDYYAAVAGITPLLLIAGFVELAVLSIRPAIWAVLTFAIPAIGGGAAALYALASYDSTPYTRFLTIWGLVATLASLIGYVVIHTTSANQT